SQIEVERALPGLLGRLDPQLPLALGGGVRLSRQQLGVDAGGLAPAARRPAERSPIGCLPLPEQPVIRLALHHLARLEAERLHARAPPPARRLAPVLAGLEVVPSPLLL